ncbi:MAG: class I SAM-dependent methyltransferase [Bacteroidales bacterium]|nr:class I SAM-dependent methyltransferase [Bacteroidales bacterium]
MEQINLKNRNFNTISPSAKSLLLMKGHTDIPFARQTAELIKFPEKYIPNFSNKDLTFWARTFHFESRYWSIDQLLEDLSIKNILELSSGFSFRGLAKINQKGVHYIDTDLPDVIETKKEFIDALQNEDSNPEGKLELLPLNALDEEQFQSIIKNFSGGEIVIVNEGLLMYLDINEKEKLCRIIYNILKEHGGYWITADIYIKDRQKKLDFKLDDKTKEFFEQHRIEENRFESFKEAEAFFKRMGFAIDKEAKIKKSKMSSLKYLIKSATLKQLFKMRKAVKIQTTWRLRIANNK